MENLEKNIEKYVKTYLKETGYKCNADARTKIAQDVLELFGVLPKPRELKLEDWAKVIEYAIEVGGAKHGAEYQYRNAQGGVSTAKVFDLYNIPENLVNPFLVCFSGYVPAAFYTAEARRAFLLKYGKKLPIFTTGLGGNKGLYANVFNNPDGAYMVGTEAEMYRSILEELIGSEDARQYQRPVNDTDAKGNFEEMYQLAKEKGLNEVTFVLCSGQPWYTKRLISEGMLEYGKPEYQDVKINLVVLDCPLTLDFLVPEGHLSEIFLGYIAASLGPLTKDTTPLTLDNPDFSKERYLLLGVAEADWSVFEELITHYSNMGWPNYQELLYGVDHKTAVFNIIMSDLRARASFTPKSYEDAIRADIAYYRRENPHRGRFKFFKREIYLESGWYDGRKHFSNYANPSYLNYKVLQKDYVGWDKYWGEENTF